MAFINTQMGLGGVPALGLGNPLLEAAPGLAMARLGGVDPATAVLAQAELQAAGQQLASQQLNAELVQLLQGLMKNQQGQQNSAGTSPSTDSGSSSPSGGSSSPSGSSSSSGSSNGSAAVSNDAKQNAQIVAQVAKEKGVDPVTAVACMLVESGGSCSATGDGGTSFGLFQLHKGGELGNMSEAEARDPKKNAEVALSEFAKNKDKYSDPGQLAAESQRPADKAGYAKKVDAMIPKAKELLGMA